METNPMMNKFLMSYRPACIRLRPSIGNQYRAMQQLIRPEEMAHLIVRRRRTWRSMRQSFVAAAAAWLRHQLDSGKLQYFSDPDDAYDYWCSPAETMARGGGDCDDLAILTASLLRAGGIDARVVLGDIDDGFTTGGHAWVEGWDHLGWFLFEATSGEFVRRERPVDYIPAIELAPGSIRRAA